MVYGDYSHKGSGQYKAVKKMKDATGDKKNGMDSKSVGDRAKGRQNLSGDRTFTVKTKDGSITSINERWFLNADKVAKKGDQGILDSKFLESNSRLKDLGFVPGTPLEIIKIDHPGEPRMFTIRSSDGKIKRLGEGWFLNSDDVNKVGDRAYLTPDSAGNMMLDKYKKEGFVPGIGYEVIKIE